MRKMMTKRGLAILTVMVIPTAPLPALAQSLFDSGSTGADGALDLTGQAGDVVIDMNDHPDGIYNYTTVSIPVDVVLKFISNAANTPVTWLASGDIVVDGTVFLRGGDGHGESGQEYSIPGPGGFAGGGRLSTIGASVGLGPGGGSGGTDGDSAGGSYATAGAGNVITYGNRFLLPLIGGSGSGSAFSVSTGIHIGGGAGGGAILIASSTRIVVNGSINADGGNGPYSVTAGLGGNGGSGGAIRLVSNEVAGIGMLSAQGGLNAGFARTGGEGRIRIEAFARVFSGSSTPAAFFSAPLFVQPPNVPTLKATMVEDRKSVV